MREKVQVRGFRVKDLKSLVTVLREVTKETRASLVSSFKDGEKGDAGDLGIDLVLAMMGDDRLTAWLAGMVDRTQEEFEELEATTILDIVEQEGFGDFFARAWRLSKPLFGSLGELTESKPDTDGRTTSLTNSPSEDSMN